MAIATDKEKELFMNWNSNYSKAELMDWIITLMHQDDFREQLEDARNCEC